MNSTNDARPKDAAGDAGKCPSDETIAAWLDGQLDAHESDAVEIHVASCDACSALVAALGPLLGDQRVGRDAPGAGEPRGVLPRPVPARTVPFWGLAAAATLIVGVCAGYLWYTSRAPEASAELTALRAVAVNQRPTYGRVTGFQWAPAPVTLRSGAPTLLPEAAMLEAAVAVERRHAGSDTPSDLHALGVAQLVAGDTLSAVRTLARAVAARPDDAVLLTDASAAHLQQAWLLSDAGSLAEARRLAERATRLAPALPSAWFNLARAASLAGDLETAERARGALARLEPAGPWLADLQH